MIKLATLGGSLRAQSWNRTLLEIAETLCQDQCEIVHASIKDFPLYNQDIEEAKGIPTAVEQAKAIMMAADGLLVATPEYNNSIPGVLKNAIDWLTRPPADMPKLFHGKAFALMGITPGGFGTLSAQTAWLPLIRYLKLRPYFANNLLISSGKQYFNEQGQASDELVQKVKPFVEGFIDFVKQT